MSLKYLAAYALVSLSKPKPTKDEVKAVVAASGAKVDAAELDYVFAQIAGKDVNTLIAEGTKKMSASASTGKAEAPKKEEKKVEAAPKKEEKKKEVVEDDDDMFGGGLF